ncbi:DUF7289 family protein [Geoglobus acetivorans]|uniref:Uncharacterized protein n=1 Tax=Geoglobus acetivorans TaxID=565033 RepID=A0A0A7GBX8_GEOAI|nr:hypothetical protein GACE_0485 [Geoglobus acetivorans]
MRDDGVSDVLDAILIIAMMVITISVLLLYGMPVIDTHQKVIRERNVVSQLVYLSEQLSKVSADVFPVSNTKFALSGGSLHVANETHVTVTVRNSTGVVLQMSDDLKSIEYTSSGFSMAIENGGVFGKTVISHPRIYLENGNLTVALFKIVGSGSAGGGLGGGITRIILKFNSTETFVFNESGNLTMEIRTKYADAWSRYLSKIGNVSVENEEVEVTIPFSRLVLTKYVVDVRFV